MHPILLSFDIEILTILGSRDVLLWLIAGKVHSIPGSSWRHTTVAADNERHTEHDGQGITPDHADWPTDIHPTRWYGTERDELFVVSGRDEPSGWLPNQSDYLRRSYNSTGYWSGKSVKKKKFIC